MNFSDLSFFDIILLVIAANVAWMVIQWVLIFIGVFRMDDAYLTRPRHHVIHHTPVRAATRR